MLKNLYWAFVGMLFGILVMGGITFYLGYHYAFNELPWIMIVDVLILVLLGIISYLVSHRSKAKAAAKAAVPAQETQNTTTQQ